MSQKISIKYEKLDFFRDIRDLPRLNLSFKDVDIIIHAAALNMYQYQNITLLNLLNKYYRIQTL